MAKAVGINRHGEVFEVDDSGETYVYDGKDKSKYRVVSLLACLDSVSKPGRAREHHSLPSCDDYLRSVKEKNGQENLNAEN